MMLISKCCHERFHARRKWLSWIEVQIRQINLVNICWSLGFIKIKVYCTMVWKTNKHRVKAFIFHKLREVLESFVQFLRNMGSEMCDCNLLKFDNRNISNTRTNEYSTSSNKWNCLLERNFYEMMRESSLRWSIFFISYLIRHISYFILVLLPNFVSCF